MLFRTWNVLLIFHSSDVIMEALASQISDDSIVCSTVGSGADQRRHQSSASLAFVRGLNGWPVKSSHKGPVTWKMLAFDDVITLFKFYLTRIKEKRVGPSKREYLRVYFIFFWWPHKHITWNGRPLVEDMFNELVIPHKSTEKSCVI